MTVTPADLVAAARKAAENAHAPYSNFRVGAAILLTDGRIVTGCNFENASYGLSLCAETVALATCNADGDLRAISEIAVIGGTGPDPVRPCGRCRQLLAEAAQVAGRDIVVHCASGDGSISETHMLSALLPHAFGPANLGLA